MKTILFSCLAMLGLSFYTVSADVKLPAIFSDHMVLERETSAPVWGWATPGESVTVSIGIIKANATADQDGKWTAYLKGLPASDQPVEMDVAGQSSQIAIHDVLIGDVWLCAGESNMAFPLKQTVSGQDEIAKADHPLIRLFVTKFHGSLAVQTDCPGEWVVCSPATTATFSAVSYYFAKEIRDSIKLPIGLVAMYGDKAPEQAWLPFETLLADSQFKALYTDRFAQNAADFQKIQQTHDEWIVDGGPAYLASISKWNNDVVKAQKAGVPPPPKPVPPEKWPNEPPRPDDTGLPSVVYNAMVAPLAPFACKGVIMYSGDSGSYEGLYFKAFPAIITEWRKLWAREDLPFIYVQLPNCFNRITDPNLDEVPQLPILRETQMLTLKTMGNTGMAIAIDKGSFDKHPPFKTAIAHRLALVARHLVYGEDIVSSGPIIDSYKVDGNKIHVVFKNVGQGLKVSPTMPPIPFIGPAEITEIKGFTIAGSDNKFAWAKATIEAPDTVCVWSDEVSSPVKVRYAWANNPEVNLCNSEDLPVSPFRSDSLTAALPDAVLVAARDDFYGIDKILYHEKESNSDEIYFKQTITPDNSAQPTPVFTPYVEMQISVKDSVKSGALVARAYFYDHNKKLIASLEAPSNPRKDKGDVPAWPAIVSKDKPLSLYFVVPDDVEKESNWSTVVVFGDSKGVQAKLYSETDVLGTLNDYDYPGKLSGDSSEVSSSRSIEHETTTDPIIQHVEATENPQQPQITLFMRLPAGITDASQAKGVLALSLLANHVDGVRRQLQGQEAADDLRGPLKFADDRKLIVLCWGSDRLWDPHKNWDDQSKDVTRETDKQFDEVANAWASGVQYFVKQYGIPSHNFLLWGESGSAQYACRLALRKPDYFLAVHIHIPSSFDKPTLEANHILWCLTTGELEAGHERSLRFYKQCRDMGYPIIYKAIEGLGHQSSPIAANLGLKFFDYALSVADQRTAYESSLNNPLTQTQLPLSTDGPVQPWIEAFRKPAYVGDTVNQEMFPYEQVDMVPIGFQTPLPTKDIADAWNH